MELNKPTFSALLIFNRPMLALGVKNYLLSYNFQVELASLSIECISKYINGQLDLIVTSREIYQSNSIKFLDCKSKDAIVPLIVVGSEGENLQFDDNIWYYSLTQSCDLFNNILGEIFTKYNFENQMQTAPKKLSKHELKVLELVCKEMTSEQIAEALYRSKRTIEGSRRQIMKKLGVSSTLGMIKRAYQLGLS